MPEKQDEPTIAAAGTDESVPPVRLRIAVLGIFLVLLATFAVCEVALRIFWHNSYAPTSTKRMMEIRVQPASRDYVLNRRLIDPDNPRVRLRTDDRSYILPTRQYDHPDATVAFLGGSVVECSAVDEDLRFPALISTLAAEKGVKINTLNAARSGTTAHDSLNNLINHVVYDRPDIVVLMHAANDIGVLATQGNYQARSGAPLSVRDFVQQGKEVAASHVYLIALVRKVLAGSLQPRDTAHLAWRLDPQRANTIDVEPYRLRLRAFVRVCRAFDMQPVLVTQPQSGVYTPDSPEWLNLGAQSRFNIVLRQVAHEEQVPLIDLVRHVESVPDWDRPMELFYDGIHVTEKGSRVYATYITEGLLPVIAGLKSK